MNVRANIERVCHEMATIYPDANPYQYSEEELLEMINDFEQYIPGGITQGGYADYFRCSHWGETSLPSLFGCIPKYSNLFHILRGTIGGVPRSFYEKYTSRDPDELDQDQVGDYTNYPVIDDP